MAVIIVLVIGVLFLRGRYKRKVKALEVGSSGRSRSRSGGSSITIGNDAGVVGGDKKEDMLGFEVAELDGAPVVKRAEMDVEGGYRELDGERSYKELDAEFGYGELDVTEKRLSGGEIKEGLEERQVEKEVNTKKKDRMEDVGKVDEGSLIGKEEEIGKGDGNAEEKGGIADEIKQAEEKKDRVNNER
ncbi:hypothetical protein QBC36DRAFT_322590 [Triangularia setosa]|uniref:Uncharacterized protein n=1 Tax=Triangularia setosa TaxID=2587417 RepID=A0AAN6WF59_9PEZI|nr:hypothetical protein QBC36DRAFT_322590 [Podospora setosa]